MIQIIKENGEVILCEKLLGVAFRGGEVYHVVEGKLDLVDILYTKHVMKHHELSILDTVLAKRAQGKTLQVVKDFPHQQ
jgi:hypothetical protein